MLLHNYHKWLNSKHSWLVEVPHVYVTTKNYFWHSDPHQLTVCDNLSDVYVDILSGILSDLSGLLFDIYSDIYISSWHFVSGILYLAFYLTYVIFWHGWHSGNLSDTEPLGSGCPSCCPDCRTCQELLDEVSQWGADIKFVSSHLHLVGVEFS